LETRHQWLTHIIPDTQEAEIRRIMVGSPPGQVVHETPSQNYLTLKKSDGVTKGVGPELKKMLCCEKSK
jgi:hypothetical protein